MSFAEWVRTDPRRERELAQMDNDAVIAAAEARTETTGPRPVRTATVPLFWRHFRSRVVPQPAATSARTAPTGAPRALVMLTPHPWARTMRAHPAAGAIRPRP